MRLVIGIDSSTTGCKAIAWDPSGRSIAEGRAEYGMAHPQPAWYEQSAESWWDGVCGALRQLLTEIDPASVDAVSVAHQRESFVPVDRRGEPLRNAILWIDERSRAQVARLESDLGGDYIHRLTGKPPSMIPALPKIVWFLENQPDLAARTAHYLDTHAFLTQRLCGTLCTSLASADPLGLLDLEAGQWADALISEIGLGMDQLPEIVLPGVEMGRVNAGAAAMTGLLQGTPVIAGGGDGQCAGLGAGVLEGSTAYLNMGTAVVSGLYSKRYTTSRAFRTLAAPVEGAYYLETCLKGGVFTVGWFVDRFAPDLRDQGDSPEEILEREAAQIVPGCDGLMLVPYWHNVLNPYWDPAASGITVGWTGGHGRGHFYRAILEGIAYEQRLATEGVIEAIGDTVAQFTILGGGSRSELWSQMIADVTGINVVRAESVEATCLGAGILAALGAGWYADAEAAVQAMTRTQGGYQPNPLKARIYNALFRDVYRPLFPTLQPLLKRLTELTEEQNRV